jgi:lantibiotic biosynthesis protein
MEEKSFSSTYHLSRPADPKGGLAVQIEAELSSSVAWRPILDGELAVRAREAVRAIAEEIPRFAVAGQPDLPGGDAGIALFYGYLARAGDVDDDLAATYLERAAEAMAEMPLSPALHGGYTGVAWAIEHLVSSEEEPGDLPEEIDAALLELVSRSPWSSPYDLVSGLVGIGVYALERRGRGADLLTALVARLDELAEPAAGGLTLRTPPEQLSPAMRAQYPAGQHNLGAAHGVPGVIALLGSAGGDAARRLRDGLGAWMRSVRQPAPGSLYPYALGGDGRPLDPACRAAWCYGDPGIAAALLRGARGCGDGGLEELALEAAGRGAARTRADADVVDAGLCHGAAGLLHLFNRLYQATGLEELRAAALRWAGEALAMRNEGVAGFRAYRPSEASPWVADPGFLTGAAGIGLALLAATTDVEPRWDAALLCDVPPR